MPPDEARRPANPASLQKRQAGSRRFRLGREWAGVGKAENRGDSFKIPDIDRIERHLVGLYSERHGVAGSRGGSPFTFAEVSNEREKKAAFPPDRLGL